MAYNYSWDLLIQECIESIQDKVQERRLQLHERQCSFLAGELKSVTNALQDKGVESFNLCVEEDRRNVCLLHLHATVKRAQKLVERCCCEGSPWIAAAMTMVNITEEVIAIVLDLRQWTIIDKVLNASVGESSHGREIEKILVEDGEEEYERLWKSLHKSNNPLQVAALQDRQELLKKLAESHTQRICGEYLELQLNTNSEGELKIDVNEKLREHTISRPLGQGSSGMVLEVKWLGHKSALKVMGVADKTEATMLKHLHHPNIVQFFHYFEDIIPTGAAGPPQTSMSMGNPTAPMTRSCILMELMPTDLHKYIKDQMRFSETPSSKRFTNMPFSIPVAIDIMLQVAQGMRHLHNDKNLAHRDLKTSNILVKRVSEDMEEFRNQGYLEVKLADFGLAKAYDNSSISEELTRKKGTTIYGAPEIFENVKTERERSLPFKADVWSFGMVCSEILTGKMPFADVLAKTTLHDLIRDDNRRPTLPDDCPGYLQYCIKSCWVLEPERRPSFCDLCRCLRHAKLLSLGLIRIQNNDQFAIFAFRTHAGMVKTMTPSPSTSPSPSPSRSTSDNSMKYYQILAMKLGINQTSKQATTPGSSTSDDIKTNGWFALQHRGVQKLNKGDFQGALNDLDAANEAKAKDPRILQNRGIVKHKLKDKKGALRDFNDADEVKPNDWTTLYNRGVVKRELGDNEGALRDLDVAHSINLRSSNVLVQRAFVKQELGNLEGALMDLDAANQVKPKNWYTLKNRAIVKEKLGDMAGAQRDKTESNKLKPK